jgi:dipeptidyl aminopeptidase/acylaminoacyl peptidase
MLRTRAEEPNGQARLVGPGGRHGDGGVRHRAERAGWSPDGKWLAFLAARGDGAKTQVWAMPRAGGEARPLTRLVGGVSDYAWSPDGKRLALISGDPEPETGTTKAGKKKTPPPIVIDRYQFKQDVEGYLTDRRDHLYLG